MNRTEIDARDQRVMARVRAILQAKQRPPKPVPWRVLAWTLAVFGAGGGLLWGELAREMPSHPAATAALPVAAESPAADVDAPAPPQPAATPLQQGSTPSKAASDSAPVQDQPAAASIVRLITCRSVRAREPVAPGDTFVLGEDARSHLFMEVHSQVLPSTLRHVYFHEGQPYCEVPLRIRHPRMRTWSHITLARPEQAGTWRVEVVDEAGSVLAQVRFQVLP